jgi:hypothetical protein
MLSGKARLHFRLPPFGRVGIVNMLAERNKLIDTQFELCNERLAAIEWRLVLLEHWRWQMDRGLCDAIAVRRALSPLELSEIAELPPDIVRRRR